MCNYFKKAKILNYEIKSNLINYFIMKLTLLPEWYPQKYILITWPHKYSDRYNSYNQIQLTYIELVTTISQLDKIIILAHSKEHQEEIIKQLEPGEANLTNIELKIIQTNDTWIRDYAPLSCLDNKKLTFIEFTFNGYGNKYPFNYDNRVPQKLLEQDLISTLVTEELILEGGSIETDGKGTLLTTTSCLLNPNRNDISKTTLEKKLKQVFAIEKIYWIENTYLAGDDTDGHIDNFVRFIDPTTIFYAKCQDQNDEHYNNYLQIEEQLKYITNSQEQKYTLVPIPTPPPILKNNRRLPASYLNFLITNNSIIVPSFSINLDIQVKNIFNKYCKNKTISMVDCCTLIQQGGGIHCSTMQLAKN